MQIGATSAKNFAFWFAQSKNSMFQSFKAKNFHFPLASGAAAPQVKARQKRGNLNYKNDFSETEIIS